MQTLLMIGLGGAVGAIGRYSLGRAFFHMVGPGFPWGTLAANVLGSFAMGLLVTAAALKFNLSQPIQTGLTVGLLGGFTTFSAFSLETALMIERSQWTHAISYSVGSVVLCVSALFAGMYIARHWL
jgi:CrcB protein